MKRNQGKGYQMQNEETSLLIAAIGVGIEDLRKKVIERLNEIEQALKEVDEVIQSQRAELEAAAHYMSLLEGAGKCKKTVRLPC